MTRARGVLAAVAGVVVVVAVAIGLGVGGSGDTQVQADFTSARGLQKDADVRVRGAVVGSVERIELADNGRARVTMRLHDGLEPVTTGASAAIRPTDLLGDVYVALTPGRGDPLTHPIAAARTLNQPRLDQLLRVFQPDVRTGLQALMVESGKALDRRGEDLNEAALRLRPALVAADDVFDELGSQNADLEGLVVNAQRATSQLARRDRDIRTLVSSLAQTVRTTGDHAPQLERAMARMPATLTQARGTADRLAVTARAAQPLTRALSRAAGPLTTTAERLGPFLQDADRTVEQVSPLTGDLRRLLTASQPTTQRLTSGLSRLREGAPDINLLAHQLVPVAPKISEGFFVNFADEAAEPGTQPLDPFADPRRNYWRGAAVFSCESFGVKIRPGCLTDVVTGRLGGLLPLSKERAAAVEAPDAKDAAASSSATASVRKQKPVLDYLLKP